MELKTVFTQEYKNEKRQLIVNLPKDCDTSNNTYPVIYVLNGNETGLLNAIIATRKLRVELINSCKYESWQRYDAIKYTYISSCKSWS